MKRWSGDSQTRPRCILNGRGKQSYVIHFDPGQIDSRDHTLKRYVAVCRQESQPFRPMREYPMQPILQLVGSKRLTVEQYFPVLGTMNDGGPASITTLLRLFADFDQVSLSIRNEKTQMLRIRNSPAKAVNTGRIVITLPTS